MLDLQDVCVCEFSSTGCYVHGRLLARMSERLTDFMQYSYFVDCALLALLGEIWISDEAYLKCERKYSFLLLMFFELYGCRGIKFNDTIHTNPCFSLLHFFIVINIAYSVRKKCKWD